MYSYPCLEVYLDKNEVSITRIRKIIENNYRICPSTFAFLVSLTFLLQCCPKCIHRCVERVVFMLSANDACWWEAWRILDRLQPGQPQHILLLLFGWWSSTGTSQEFLKVMIKNCNIYRINTKWTIYDVLKPNRKICPLHAGEPVGNNMYQWEWSPMLHC